VKVIGKGAIEGGKSEKENKVEMIWKKKVNECLEFYYFFKSCECA